MEYPLNETEAQWKEELGKKDTAFAEKKVERPHTGTYNTLQQELPIVGASNELFEKQLKFDTLWRWPSLTILQVNQKCTR
jgi:peptide methionine sulfoxide reductase MsrB